MGAQMAKIDCKPGSGDVAGFWVSQGISAVISLFNYSCPIGSIIDMTCDLSLVDTEAATVGPTTTGATVGRVYGRHLSNTNVTAVGLTPLP
jgi:hypothetical protein